MAEKNVVSPSATTVAHFIAKGMIQTGKQKKELTQELAESISEIEMQTQIKGASFLKVHLVDPFWDIATSGIANRSPEGLLPDIEVEFPEHSGFLWHLCACELTNEYTLPNLILTFEDKIVHELREESGEKRASPGLNIRARFIQELVREASHRHPKEPIKTRIPSVEGAGESAANRSRALIEAGAGSHQVLVEKDRQQAEQQAEKSGGIHVGMQIKIKGAEASQQQKEDVDTAIAVANELNAGPTATIALLCAGIAESSFERNASEGGNPSNIHKGIWQAQRASLLGIPFNAAAEVAAQAKGFLKGGEGGFASPGAIARANKGESIQQICQQTEVTTNTTFESFKGEAEAMLTAFGSAPGVKKGGGKAKTKGGTKAQEQKSSEVCRGITQNPLENSWDAITRMAQQVNWFAFTNGRTFYYMDGEELIGQRPTAVVDPRPGTNKLTKTIHGRKVTENDIIQVPLTSTFDNTTLEYLATRKIKGRTPRRSRVGKPQTPSEIRMNVVCEIGEYRAGEVFFFQNGGPLNGRWIIVDNTRLCIKDHHSQLILEPPAPAIPETAEGTPIPKTAATPGKGDLNAVVQVAEQAVREQAKYQYVFGGGREPGASIFEAPPRRMDCSAFITLCYKQAGMPDPSGTNYSSIGTTQTMIEHMKPVPESSASPGDCIFYGELKATDHVALYIGGGQCINMGGPGDPKREPVFGEAEPGKPKLGYWTLP